jgi:murein DD-endopeptidase MepM/ murein hydrolase activator NlpD
MPLSAAVLVAAQATLLPPNPWKGLPPPPAGHERWEGKVAAFDAAQHHLSLDVDSVWNERGDERFYGRPDRREVSLGAVPMRWSARTRRPPAPSDLKPGQDVAVIWKLGEAGLGAAVEVVLAAPDAPPASRSGARGAAARPGAAAATIDPDGVSNEVVVVPMVFPMIGKARVTDTFLASRGGGTRRHHGQDIMAPRMTPLVAAFDGVVSVSANPGHYWLTLVSDDGWRALYMHMNNDTPGTDDGKGGERFAFAPGVKSGASVRAGELLGWVGDSGNAEGVGPHLHFELHTPEGHVVNAVHSLREAERIAEPVPRQAPVALPRKSGHSRLDGTVHEYDKERDVLVIVVASIEDDAGARASLTPDLKYIKDAARTAGTNAFPAGSWVVAVGADPGGGKAFEPAALQVSG